MPVIPLLGLGAGVTSGGGDWEVQAVRVQTARRSSVLTHLDRSDCLVMMFLQIPVHRDRG